MRAFVVAVAVGLVAVSGASAGGDFADLTAHGATVWTVGVFGLRELDARSGRTLYVPQPANARYPLSVAVAGGAAWVASVENGYVDGEVTRIDLRTHRSRVVLRDTITAVSASTDGVYGLADGEVVHFSLNGRVTRRWAIVDAGRVAADASGCWVSTTHRLLHIRPDGRIIEVLADVQLGDVATGGDAVWLPQADSVIRVDERTGVVRGIRTGRLFLGGFQHDVAIGDGALWILDTRVPALQRRSLQTGHLEKSVALPGTPDAVAARQAGVWVVTAVDHQLLRFDPRTLRRTLAVQLD